MVTMTAAEAEAELQTNEWTRYLTARPRQVLIDLLRNGSLPDAREATVREYLRVPQNRVELLRTPNFWKRSLGELLAAVGDPQIDPKDTSAESARRFVQQEIRRQLDAVRSGVERLERLLDA